MKELIHDVTWREIKCNFCGCKFRFQREDVIFKPVLKDGAVKNKCYVICPTCNEDIKLKRSGKIREWVLYHE